MKSICASIAFPAWVLGRDPSRRIICVSYAEDLAVRFSMQCRAVMQAPWYRKIFPGTRISRDKNTQRDFGTTRQGFRYATSVGGTLTGMGGSIIILDDPLKPDDALSETKRPGVNHWFDSTLYSRLDNKQKDVIILVMQRLHLDDLAGHVTQKEPWVHLNLPAIAEQEQQVAIGPGQTHLRRIGDLLQEERDGQLVLDLAKVRLGSFNFSAQYQQCPVPLEGEILKWSWFGRYDQKPGLEYGDQIVQSWDTASKGGPQNDYSVCTTWLVKGQHYYLLDVLRDRLQYPDLKRKIVENALRYEATTILIEDTGSGSALLQDLRYDSGGAPPPIGIRPEGDKVMRMSAQSAKIEAGRIHLPEQAPWLEEFRLEVQQFPNGSHDDQIDSVSQFLNWIEGRGNRYEVVSMWDVLKPPSAPPW